MFEVGDKVRVKLNIQPEDLGGRVGEITELGALNGVVVDLSGSEYWFAESELEPLA